MAKHETSGEEAQRAAAAGAAIVDFLNSRPHATPTLPDTLSSPEEAARVLRPFSTNGELALSEDDLRRLRGLRADLMTIVAPSDPVAERTGWERVSQHAAAVPFRYAFPGTGEVRVEPAAGSAVLGNVIGSVAELLSTGNWSRVKACANPACSHVFYDTTRSRTQRWDSYEVCGNRINVAAYRTRRARPGRPP